jgi:hypothetical protein
LNIHYSSPGSMQGMDQVRLVDARSTAVEHDPEKWVPVFPRDKRQGRLRGDHAQSKR